ncbi:MAG TPA: hypothetical protein EYQ09_06695 [Flavobacteriales bacterium]|nr:hypothetical protein [Flavobacteriales bacterium]HIK62836.1 hypothetical protein [Flavobacteriales bacterium]
MKTLVFLIVLLFFTQVAMAQITITSITLNGNLKTQNDIILRELSFEENKSYSNDDLTKRIEKSKENLVNLKLFNFVEINKNEIQGSAQITVDVIERWYILPYPIFEISERNFNAWWEEFAANDYSDFSRLNYGVFLNWENFRGRNELIQLKIRKGFKEHYLLAYDVPYFNKNKTIGINTSLGFFRRKKTYYNTDNNSLKYFESDNFNSIDYDLNTEIVYRNNIHQKHKIKFTYLTSTVSDSIIILNPNYLGNSNTTADLFNISYVLEHEKRDYSIYPLHGYALSFEIKKYFSYSTNVHHSELLTKAEKHIELFNRLYLGSSFKTKYSTKGNQPYFIQKALGYEDYVRGYEYYVVDGQSYWLSKTAIKCALIEKTNFEIPYVKMKQFKKSHYSLYLGVFSDLGYVLNEQPENTLNNSLLWGKGIALDYVTYYDKLLRIEYSINRLGEKAVFLHFSSPF